MCVSPRNHDCVATFSPGETVRWSEREKATSNRERARGCPPRDVTRFTTPRGRRRARESMADWNREKTRDRRRSAGPGFGEIFLRVRGVTERKAHPPSAHPALTVDANGTRQSGTGSGRVGNAMVRDRRTRARRASGRRALVVDGGVPCTGRRDERKMTSGRLARRGFGDAPAKPHRDSLPHGDQPSPGGPGDRSAPRRPICARRPRSAPPTP